MALAEVFFTKVKYGKNAGKYIVGYGDYEGDYRYWPDYTTSDYTKAQRCVASQTEKLLKDSMNIFKNGFPDGYTYIGTAHSLFGMGLVFHLYVMDEE